MGLQAVSMLKGLWSCWRQSNDQCVRPHRRQAVLLHLLLEWVVSQLQQCSGTYMCADSHATMLLAKTLGPFPHQARSGTQLCSEKWPAAQPSRHQGLIVCSP